MVLSQPQLIGGSCDESQVSFDSSNQVLPHIINFSFLYSHLLFLLILFLPIFPFCPLHIQLSLTERKQRAVPSLSVKASSHFSTSPQPLPGNRHGPCVLSSPLLSLASAHEQRACFTLSFVIGTQGLPESALL